MELSIPFNGGKIKLDLVVEDGVHHPGEAVIERLKSIEICGGESALDLGCGCGVYGLFAAKAGCREVTLTDVCPAAVSSALVNARLNGLQHVKCLQGDFFEPVTGQRFDIVFANLPQTPAPHPIQLDKWGGPEGTQYLTRLATEAPNYLKPGGSLYFCHTGLANPNAVNDLFSKAFDLKVVNQRDRFFQREEYESYQPGLFHYLMDLRKAGKAKFESNGEGWCFQTRFIRASKK
ncbi:MAG: class I SAM-dependent methyltransferase [Planctomycetota bacterium]|nr:class I SAM-dependent methyltransferase [Planctomycetota bacterium]